MKNIELAKIGEVHFNTITKIRKIIGVKKMDKRNGEQFIKEMGKQPLVSSFEFAEIMSK
jgi:hypothetical protein